MTSTSDMDTIYRQLLAVRNDLHQTAAKIFEDIKDKSITHIASVTAKYNRLSAVIASYNANHERIVLHNATCINNEESIPCVREEFDNIVDAIEVSIFKLRERIAQKAATSVDHHDEHDHSKNVVQGHKPKLAPIKIPHFKGSIAYWADFIASYDALIHENSALSDVEKFHQLRSLLENEPLNLISHFTISDANYPIAYRKLRARYQNDRILAAHYANELINFKTTQLHNNLNALEHYFSSHSDSVKRLNALSLDDDYDFLCFHISYSHLDRKLQERFDEAHPPDQIHSYETLMNFVQTHIRSVELHQFTNLSLNAKSPVPSNRGIQKLTKSKPSALVSRNVSAPSAGGSGIKYPCPHCNEMHFLSTCPSFSSASLRDKREFLAQQQRCVVCLGKHSVHECRSRYLCPTCKERHHLLLHDSSSASGIQAPAPSSLATGSVHHSNVRQVLLATSVVYIKDAFNQFHAVRALLDSCSEISVITDACARRLGLPIAKRSSPLSGIGQTPAFSHGSATFTIHSKLDWKISIPVSAYIMDKIAGLLPSTPISSASQQRFASLQLADPQWFQPGEIDLLLGADIYSSVLKPEVPLPGEITAISTVFGYVLMGSATSISNGLPTSLVALQPSLEQVLMQFWQTEEVNTPPPLSYDDSIAETNFLSQFSRSISGRFSVPLLFKSSTQLGNNRHSSLRSYLALERRLHRNPEQLQAYYTFMQEYLSLGHMTPSHTPQPYVIPHHVVHKYSSSTTKTRVVFNASARSDANTSLNELLLPGPKLQSDITQILFSFRLHRIALCGDIRMMYRQIEIRPQERQFQHIFWRPDPAGPVLEYELNTVTYGLTSSAFLAQRCIAQLIHEDGHRFPMASRALRSEIYVDDVITGGASSESTLLLRDQLISLMSLGGFQLRKWMSNEPSVLDGLPQEHLEANLSFEHDDSYIKILGLSWDPPSDSFKYSIEPFSLALTKRNILSYLARTFDPMGWIAPIVIWIKCFLQRLWLNSLDWDEVIPDDISHLWRLFASQLPTLSQLRIPRFLQNSPSSTLTLVGFADASSSAFAACVYLHIAHGSEFSSMLVQAKTKVASTKTQSIARLELNAALLLSRLVHILSDRNPHLFSAIHLFSDSQNVLHWVSNSPHRYKTYVANRITKINELTASATWHYVPTLDNPADCASRGQLPCDFLTNTLWWHGPSFLLSPPSTWTEWTATEPLPSDSECKPLPVTLVSHHDELLAHLAKFSSYTKLLRVVSYMLRFINLLRGLPVRKGPILVWELNCSLFLLIKLIQHHHFRTDIKAFASGGPLSPQLRKLSPFLDHSGVFRVGGRLGLSSLPFESKHPAILPKDSFLSTLIIQYFHSITCHSGPTLIRAIIHKRFWLLSSQSLIRSILRRCVRCIRFKSQPSQPIMGQLPSSRVTPSAPFSITGTDFAGPFLIKEGRRRTSTRTKSYLCVFVCATTKAVHLELVSSLATPAFLAAFDRFVSRRGCPTEVFSDCGKTFISANRQLREFAQFLDANSDHILSALSAKGIHWKFNPPYAPNFGGLFEAAVKSAKRLLYKTLGDSAYYQDELLTMFARIEAILNSRPLSSLPSESDSDNDYLTPGHFLIGRSLLAPPEAVLDETDSLLCRWSNLRRLSQSFWRRFSSEYLNTLTSLSKWQSSSSSLQLRQLVIVPDVKTTPLSWPLGRVVQLHPGPDGIVRVVTVYCRGSCYRRPVNKLVPLPSDF